MDIEIIRGIATVLTVTCLALSAVKWKQRYYRKPLRSGWLLATISTVVLLSVLAVCFRPKFEVLLAGLTYLWLLAAVVWLAQLFWHQGLKRKV